MKFISWNVNGLRAVAGKGFADIFERLDADFFCLQETKLSAGQLDLEFLGYQSYWNYAEKKGYSGTAVYARHTPLSVSYGLGVEEHDHEGRVLTLEMPDFVVICGDMNVAHEEIDLKNPATNHFNAGFSDEERAKMTELLAAGFRDSWRDAHPGEAKYSWWSYRMAARERNVGWRIDYFLVSEGLAPRIAGTDIHNEIFGSDHCPVELVLFE